MSKVSTLRLAMVYALWLIAGVALVLALMEALVVFFQTDVGNPAMGLIMIYVAAASVGSYWWKREGRPSKSRMWGVAFACMLMTALLQGGILAAVVATGVSLGSFGVSKSDLGVLAGVLGVFLLVEFLVIRLAIGMSINANEKQAAKKAAKAA